MNATTTPTTDAAGANAREQTHWYRVSVAAAVEAQRSSFDGLTPDDAEQRLVEFGSNELVDNGSSHPLKIIWQQVSAVMVLILIGAALLSLALGKYLEAGAIGAIVVLFTLLGFFQEYRAERAIAALRQMSMPVVKVRRAGRTVELPAAQLVPGDIVQLDAGTVVPADLRLIEVANLRIEEATLTGESEPVDKHTDLIDRTDVALGDRRCLAFSGTQVSAGRGLGLVVATGMRTELGRIATLLQSVKTRIDAVAGAARSRRQTARPRRGRRCRARGGDGRVGRRVRVGSGSHRHQCRCCGDSGGSARRGHVHARDRSATHASTQRADPQAPRSRNPRFGDGDLLGQDGHAHPEQDDGDDTACGGRAHDASSLKQRSTLRAGTARNVCWSLRSPCATTAKPNARTTARGR